ncbi:MAG: phenylalanyl-tRNA synthetase subunit beta [Deltaproteobacteria bacterium]|nr:phenylalanyl-tRNA synthetase subunit beta [Deltaproteobacteria bacterium]
MKITLNWLRELVDVVLSPDELADTLVMAGLEVESIEERRPVWKQVEIATIESVAAHPNADRLRLCQVRRAHETVSVVCGASNMQAGDKVALAVPGTVLPDDKRIEQASIRGQASHGMLCSARELELSEGDGGGILILPPEAAVGMTLVAYLGAEDTILELSMTPNRGDCLSVLGVAREVAALTGAPLHDRFSPILEEKTPAARIARVEVQAPDLCPHYNARIVRGLRVGTSPLWMQMRLSMVGLRPISNVVDATNYVMLERGQPLHAFDLDRLRGRSVNARRAGTRQRYETLDGVVRELLPEDLVIADAEGPVALAGIIGGADSEIRSETEAILLESAFFTPETVRRTARRLGVSTESSYRFERGVDPAGTRKALDRVTQLIVAHAGGEIARGVLEDHAPGRRTRAAIRLRPARVNFMLGTNLKVGEMERPLRALGATVSGRGPLARRVVPPSHRFDLQNEMDLVEEIARLTGYDSVPATVPAIAAGGPGAGPTRDVEQRLRERLQGAGFDEMVTLAMVAAEDNLDFSGLPELAGKTVGLANPLSVESAELRRSLLPGLVRILDENRRQGAGYVAGFTVGRVFGREDDRYHEIQALALLLCGAWPPATVGAESRACDFADLKGVLELIFAELHLDAVRWERVGAEAGYLHPGKAARIEVGGVLCGYAGALHPNLIASRHLDAEPWVAELDLMRVVQYCPRRVIFRQLPRFPAVTRDIAVLVDDEFPAQRVVDAVKEADLSLLEEVRVFDQYTGSPIPVGKKSLAYTIAYRAPNRTLTDDEVNAMHDQLVAQLVRQLPLEVRR